MYFPILRSKQFELIALREIASKKPELNSRLHPVIEPVKKDLKGIERAINELSKNGFDCTVIANPKVGEITTSRDDLLHMLNKYVNSINIGIYIESDNDIDSIQQLLKIFIKPVHLTLIHTNKISEFDTFKSLFSDYQIDYNLFFENTTKPSRYRGLIESDSWVKLNDNFTKEARNADYSETEYFFSDDHLFFTADNYTGFADYSITGSDYNDSGFSPRAVAIHLTYINEEKNDEIWIRHFKSESNKTIADVAGKYEEALEKLVEFANVHNLDNMALSEFRRHLKQHTYPGLGTIKKLCLINHIEVSTSHLS